MLNSNDRGVTGVSYGLVVGLIGVVALLTVTQLGNTVNTLFEETSGQLAVGTAAGSGNDSAPPTIAAGQSLDVDEGQSGGAPVGQVSADDNVQVAGFSISSGDPGGVTPYFAISATGLITLTADGASNLSGGQSVTLGVVVTDAAGNTASADVGITINSVAFTCSSDGGPPFASVTDANNPSRIYHLCDASRSGFNAFDGNTNVHTACNASDFDGNFTSSTGTEYGLIRYETVYRTATSVSTGQFVRYRCSGTNCINDSVSIGPLSLSSSFSAVQNASFCTYSTSVTFTPNTYNTRAIYYSGSQSSGYFEYDYYQLNLVNTTLITDHIRNYTAAIRRTLAGNGTKGNVNTYYYIEIEE
ncbi:MAG: hypothetical protein Alpg2KO_29670 [Alphaproteobacteria bacterium]